MKYLIGFGLIAAGYFLTKASFSEEGGVIFYGLMLVGGIIVIKEWTGIK